MLLFIWVIIVAVIPKTAVMIAEELSPIPYMHEITAQKEAINKEISRAVGKKFTEYQKKNIDLAKKNYEEFIKQRNKLYEETRWEKVEKIAVANAKIDEEYQAKQRKQEILAMNLSRISPASALTFGAISLGKTGVREHENFLNSLRLYKSVFSEWIITKNIQAIDERKGIFTPPPKLDNSDMPQFEFKPESIQDSFARAIPDFTILILMIIIFFIGTFVSFLKYDVR